MKDDRNNMFFPGQQGMGMPPMGQMGPGMGMPPMGQMGPGMGGVGFPGGMIPNIGQLENRVASLERQVKRLDARVNRLETPYPTPTPYAGAGAGVGQSPFTATEPQQDGAYTYPYQTSMQVM